ncbi:MAG TPA: GTP pyrophosphokinase family protein [Candidatus Aphodomonas merdavium]|nr:GTP pyrophosphokinase family protein [Candidatus Aphodomonas merdavium]
MILEKRDFISPRTITNLPQTDAEGAALLKEYAAVLPSYRGAMKKACAKFEVLDDEFRMLYERAPIHHIEQRIKSPESLLRKMRRKGLPMTLEAMKEGVRDIAGIRIVCAYLDDIYCLAEMLVKQDDVTLLRRRDYVANPKESGYRGLHLLITLPVHLASQKLIVPVEVQLRTIAMDSWATLEHELQYKNASVLPAHFADQLRMCAETASVLDRNMQSIMQQIECHADVPQEDGEEK